MYPIDTLFLLRKPFYSNIIYEGIFESIFQGLIKQNKLSPNFFTKLPIKLLDTIPFISLLKRVIVNNYNIDYTQAIKTNILHRTQSNISYSNNSDIYSILSYFASKQGDYSE